MRPVIEKRKFRIRYLLYAIILIICIISVSIAIYMQFYRDENLSVIFGIKKENQEEEEITNLKSNFINIFNNKIEIVKSYTNEAKKTDKDKELIYTSTELDKESDNYSVNLKLPTFNIESEITKKYNKEIETTFLDKANSIINIKNNKDVVIYNVKYKAYLYDN